MSDFKGKEVVTEEEDAELETAKRARFQVIEPELDPETDDLMKKQQEEKVQERYLYGDLQKKKGQLMAIEKAMSTPGLDMKEEAEKIEKEVLEAYFALHNHKRVIVLQMSSDDSVTSPIDPVPRPTPEEVAPHPEAPVAQGYISVSTYYKRFIQTPTYHRYALIGPETLVSIFMMGLRPELRELYRGFPYHKASLITMVGLAARAEIRQAEGLVRNFHGWNTRRKARRGVHGRWWDGRWYAIPIFVGEENLPKPPTPDRAIAKECMNSPESSGYECDGDSEGMVRRTELKHSEREVSEC